MLVDIIIVILLGLAAWIGYRAGAVAVLIDLGGLILSLTVAVWGYEPLSHGLIAVTKIFPPLARLSAFVLIWLIAEVVYGLTLRRWFYHHRPRWRGRPVNHWLGLPLGLVRGLVLTALALSIFAALPVESATKDPITSTAVARRLLGASSGVQRALGQLIGEDFNRTLNFLTVKPKSEERVDLGFTTTRVKVDAAAENQMLDLVNAERTNRGLRLLVMDERLRDVARAHVRDMFARGYFAHVSPEGKTPFDRLDASGIRYRAAGENLALAPTLFQAHQGLMNSPGHRANILSDDYGRVGIGCIDGGRYGLMFAQEFTN